MLHGTAFVLDQKAIQGKNNRAALTFEYLLKKKSKNQRAKNIDLSPPSIALLVIPHRDVAEH